MKQKKTACQNFHFDRLFAAAKVEFATGIITF